MSKTCQHDDDRIEMVVTYEWNGARFIFRCLACGAFDKGMRLTREELEASSLISVRANGRRVLGGEVE